MLAFLVLGFLIYSNGLEGPFVLDDTHNVENNTHIRLSELSMKGLLRAAFESPCPHRPVANISFALGYYLHGGSVEGYRLVNIAIHIITGILLYLFIKITLQLPTSDSPILRFSDSGSHSMISFFAALLWLVHPVQTESVTYIVQRMNSMAAMFYLLAFLLYVEARVTEKTWKRLCLFASSLFSALLALGSKEIAATLPFSILLYEWYFFQDLSGQWLRRRLGMLLLILAIGVGLAFAYLSGHPLERLLSHYELRPFSLMERILTELRVVVYYVTLLLFPKPSRLNLDYDFPISHSLLSPPTTLMSLVGIAAFLALAIYLARRHRLISFAILWFFGNLVIESSVIGLEIIFEHRLYLPSMFVGLVAVVLIYRHIGLEWLRLSLVCAMVLVLSTWTYQRNSVWSNEEELWRDCVEKSPSKCRPYVGLGIALYKEGRLDEAAAYHTKALQINASAPMAHSNLGAVYLKQGKFKEAVRHLSQALELMPGYDDARKNLDIALRRIGRPGGQAQEYNRRAIGLAGQGRIDEAIAQLSKALEIDPGFAEAHYNMGNAMTAKGRLDEAVSHFSKAVKLKPGYAEAHNNMGIALARQGKLDKAISSFSEAVRIKGDFIEARSNLERALQQAGRVGPDR